MAKIRLGDRTFDLPKNRVLRIVIGVLLVVFGIFGILPILGFWMIPLGFIVLSVDIPLVRRWRRQALVRLGHWLKTHYPALAQRLGFANGSRRSQRQ